MAKLFESLLMTNTEPLFFIDNGESKVFKNDIFLQQAVCPDQNINDASLDVIDYRRLFLARLKSAYHSDAYWEGGKSSRKVLEMLIG